MLAQGVHVFLRLVVGLAQGIGLEAAQGSEAGLVHVYGAGGKALLYACGRGRCSTGIVHGAHKPGRAQDKHKEGACAQQHQPFRGWGQLGGNVRCKVGKKLSPHGLVLKERGE